MTGIIALISSMIYILIIDYRYENKVKMIESEIKEIRRELDDFKRIKEIKEEVTIENQDVLIDDQNEKLKNEYYNEDMGIKFQYNANTTTIIPTNDTVEVKLNELQGKGQHIKMLQKDPSLTLSEAIEEYILIDTIKVDCRVNTSLYQDMLMGEEEIATIEYKLYTDRDVEITDGAYPQYHNCPEEYVFQNGASYFVMDKNYSDRFYYISLGQYNISTEKGVPWNSTIQIF